MKDCSKKKGRLLDLCLCKGQDGRPDPKPETCEKYRRMGLLQEITPTPSVLGFRGSISQRSVGLGDTIAKLSRRLGITKALTYISKKLGIKTSCGCSGRQAKLNTWFPYKKG